MSVSYNDGLNLAKVSLREDKNRLKPDDWIGIAEQTVLHFSKDAPRELVYDFTGNNTKQYTLSGVVTGWVNRFSKIKRIEYPINSDPITYIQGDNYQIYKAATDTEKLVLKSVQPSASQHFYMTYTGMHTFSTTTTTIDDQDKIIFCTLMAHYAAMALVSDFLKPNRSNLPNDSNDFSQKMKDMSDLASQLLKKYADLLSGKTESVKSYSTVVRDYDMVGRYGNRYFTVPDDER